MYREGDTGNHMYFLNSGTVEVTTKDGSRALRKQGDFFGEGALLHAKKKRSATIKCVTPVHVIEISREYFDKYLASDELGLALNLREKNKTRKRNRAKTILNLQRDNLRDVTLKKGEYLFEVGGEGKELYILENGRMDVKVEDHTVFTLGPGDIAGMHSLLFSRPHNTSALCVSDECKINAMPASDFHAVLKSSPTTKEALQEIECRRDFQKAIVFKTKQAFPSDPKDLRAAFDAADEDDSGFLSLDNVRSMLKRMDPTLTEQEIQSILMALDLNESGDVCFEEFVRIFQANEAAASI